MLSNFSVKKPYTVLVAVVIVLVMGAMSFLNLSTDLLPSMNLPYTVVMTTYVGASPEEVETALTRPIEASMATTTGIESIRSVSRENLSVVILEYNDGINMDSVMIEMRESLDLLRNALPERASNPAIMKINPDMLPIMMTSVDAPDMDLIELSALVEQTLKPALEGVEGVASVTANGLVEQRIEITIDYDRLNELNKIIYASIEDSLKDAYDALDEGKQKIEDGWETLEDTEKEQTDKLDSAAAKIATGKKQLREAEDQLLEGESQLLAAREQLASGIAAIDEQLPGLEAAEQQLASQVQELLTQIDTLNALPSLTEEQATQLAELMQAHAEASAQLTQMQQSKDDLTQQRAQLAASLEETGAKLEEVEAGKEEIKSQLSSLSSASGKVSDGRKTLAEEIEKAEQELTEGEEEIETQTTQLAEQKEQAKARADLTGILTAQNVSSIITAQNLSLPAGYITEDENRILVKIGDKFADPDELKSLLLFTSDIEGLEKISLEDIATVETTTSDDDAYVRVNGNPGIILSYNKQTQYPTSEVAARINEKQGELASQNDVHFSVLVDQGVYIDTAIGSVLQNLIYGAILAIIVLALFLRSIKPTIIVACSIPISVVFAISMMYFSGVTLNVISLGGLALGIGMLVDNSIVAIENIYRLRGLGMPAKEAAIQGAKEIAGAITASTLTTMCVFLPIVFDQGISRQLFSDMGLTIAFSLIASLLVALTLVPAMSASVFRTQDAVKKRNVMVDTYSSLLQKALKFKPMVLLVVVGLFALSLVLAFNMGMVFIPEADSTQISVTLTPPEEATDNEVNDLADSVMNEVLTIEDVETVGALRGGAGSMLVGNTGGGGPVDMYVILKEDRSLSIQQINELIYEKTANLPGEVEVAGSNADMSSMIGGSGIQLNVSGPDADTLQELAGQAADMLRSIDGTKNVDDGSEDTAAELRLTVDKEKAMLHNLTTAQVYAGINALLKENEAATLPAQYGEYTVVITDGIAQGVSREELLNLELTARGSDGNVEKVRLGDIVTLQEVRGLSSIHRSDQQRYITVSADVDEDHNIGLIGRDVTVALDSLVLPDGYTVELVGENETITDTFNDLMLLGLLAIILIYLIMVAQFQSLLSPFIVMFTLPLAFTGGLLTLVLTGMELSVVALLGLVILFGIVVNNGIVFVDCINRLRSEGMEKYAAIIEAGKLRLRPILMTSLTTILALSTLAFGVGTGSDMMQPMAVTTIGGMLYSTVLTLFVVPILYSIMQRDKKHEP